MTKPEITQADEAFADVVSVFCGPGMDFDAVIKQAAAFREAAEAAAYERGKLDGEKAMQEARAHLLLARSVIANGPVKGVLPAIGAISLHIEKAISALAPTEVVKEVKP
jgi:hypothetical protein